MTSSDELLRNARAATGSLPAEPRRKLAVVTCMDTRINPLELFGAGRGDIHVIQNAGGIVTQDTMRSLVVSQRRLGTTAIDVVMHTDCGMIGLDEDELGAQVAADGGRITSFGGFDDVRTELRSAIERLRTSPDLQARDRIRGLIYDVDTGNLATIIPI